MVFTAIIRVFLGLLFLLAPGYLQTHIFFNSKQWSLLTRSFTSIIFALTTTPLITFEIYYFWHQPVTPNLLFTVNCLLIVTLILVCFFLDRHYFHLPPFHILHYLSSCLKSRFLFVVTLLLGLIIVVIPLFFKHQPIPGPDTPVYLYNSAIIYGTHQIPKNLDRSVVYLIPTLTAYLTGLSVYASLKLMIIILYLLSGVSVYLFSRNFFPPTLSALAMLIAFVNQGLLGLSLHVFAFEFGIIIINLLLTIITSNHKLSSSQFFLTTIIISWFWGLLFNLHGIVSFGSLLILGPPLGLYLFHQKQLIFKSTRTSLILLSICLVVFIASSVPLFYRGWTYVYRGWFMPVSGVGMNQPQPPPNQNLHGPMRVAVVNSQTNKLQFPALQALYLTTYSTPIILLALVGLLYILICFKNSQVKHPSQSILILTIIGYFLLTQQQFLGVDWYSGRFIMAMYPLIIVFAFYGINFIGARLRAFKQLQDLPQYAQLSLVLLISSPLLVHSFVFWKTQFVAFVKPQDFDFYQHLPKFLDQTSSHSIFYSGTDQNWLIGLNPTLSIFAVENIHICNPQYNNIGLVQWNITESFCDNTSLDDSLNNLAKYSGDPHYYVIIQANSSTADLSKFTNNHYQTIYNQDRLFLFQRL